MAIRGFLRKFGATQGSAAEYLLMFFDVVLYYVALHPFGTTCPVNPLMYQ